MVDMMVSAEQAPLDGDLAACQVDTATDAAERSRAVGNKVRIADAARHISRGSHPAARRHGHDRGDEGVAHLPAPDHDRAAFGDADHHLERFRGTRVESFPGAPARPDITSPRVDRRRKGWPERSTCPDTDALATGFGRDGLVAPAVLRAQAYPARPVRLVVPFPPGGTTDIGVARAFADLFARELNQPVVIDYRPGAVTNIGTESVGPRPSDGYTLLFGSSVMATNFATGPVPPFDPAKTTPTSRWSTRWPTWCAPAP